MMKNICVCLHVLHNTSKKANLSFLFCFKFSNNVRLLFLELTNVNISFHG